MVTEMIHTASLVHDDVIDMASIRRGKPSVSEIWSRKKVMVKLSCSVTNKLLLSSDHTGREFHSITCIHDLGSNT